MAGISPKLPLSLSVAEGPYTSLKELKEVVKQNLIMLLLTIPGERIMDPEFGVGLDRFLFEPNDPSVMSEINNRIEKQLVKYMPFLSIKGTYFGGDNIGTEEVGNTLSITIAYYINPLAEEDVLSINIPENSF